MRWILYTLECIAIAVLQLLLAALVLTRAPVYLLFLLAYHASLRAAPSYTLMLFWFAGLIHDLALGYHLGANMLLFWCCGLVVYLLRNHIVGDHWVTRIFLVMLLTFLVNLLRPALDFQAWSLATHRAHLVQSFLSSLLTGLISPVAAEIIQHPYLRPWRIGAAHYGLPKA